MLGGAGISTAKGVILPVKVPAASNVRSVMNGRPAFTSNVVPLVRISNALTPLPVK
jgi:hypothetical protein